MTLLKVLCVAATLAVVCEAALPGQNQYLPPDNGYKYNTPSKPFPTPPYRPPPPTPPVITQPPTYRPPPPTPQIPTVPPTYGPPTGPPLPPVPPPVPPPYPPATRPPYPGGDTHDHVHMPGMPFDFEYNVNDDAHGAYYGHRANSNGDVVQGEYHVNLPDGRTQVVKYTADWATGFHAEVSYQGEARYPAPQPAPAYGPPQQQQQPPQQQTGY